ncbi:MAG: 5'/3'-nucleotidase SurE [Bacteroidota bacterium]|nr:5'/3'-nucleotidase SurE [Bacteroidota bacterium]
MKKICPKCGKEFECRHNKDCFCMRYRVSKENLAEMKKQYNNCLCEDCLTFYAKKTDNMIEKPLIFVTNDDGYLSNGIRALIDILKPMGKVVSVAPLREMSGQSHSITVGKPLSLSCISKTKDFEEYALDGTPVDCVKMAFDKVLCRKPDFLFAGINHGSNVSINTIYSGTMAAVMEGCSEGVASVGFSLCNDSKESDFAYCLPFVEKIAKEVVSNGLAKDVCLNVNFPDGEIKGIKVGHQAKGYWSEDFKVSEQRDGKSIFWLGGEYHCEDESPLADWNLIKEDYAAVVPMQVDFTAYKVLENIKNRFEK